MMYLDYNSFDEFYAVIKTCKPFPLRRGFSDPHHNAKQKFCSWLLTEAKFFLQEEMNGKQVYVDPFFGYTYAGDAFLNSLDWDWVSDWYKDCFGCRPHFDKDLFALVCGLHTFGDTAFHWTYGSLEDYAERVTNEHKWYEEHWDELHPGW